MGDHRQEGAAVMTGAARNDPEPNYHSTYFLYKVSSGQGYFVRGKQDDGTGSRIPSALFRTGKGGMTRLIAPYVLDFLGPQL